MPDDWGDDFDGDWDLDGDEMMLDDELEFEDELGFGTEEPDDDWDVHGMDETEAGVFDDAELDEFEPTVGSPGAAAPGGGGGGSPGDRETRGGGEQMSWSAWDVGTVFAMGGWMLDQHAEQVGSEVRAALASSPTAAAPRPGPLGAPNPPPPSGLAYGTEEGELRVGDPLVLRWLYSQLTAAQASGRDLLLQVEGTGPGGGPLVLVISVVPETGGPSLWVVAEQHPGGFAASRLVPVFQADASGHVAVFATDLPAQAVDAVAWACSREGVETSSLTVTR